ncbi:MAG: hypothetical protein QW717_08160 [Candidatus Bathyarchaeia archaeon]
MEKTLYPARIRRLYRTLERLGYGLTKIDGKRSEWRKDTFHLYVYPNVKSGLKLKLHKDLREAPPPSFKHKVVLKDKDIKEELERIRQKYLQNSAEM